MTQLRIPGELSVAASVNRTRSSILATFPTSVGAALVGVGRALLAMFVVVVVLTALTLTPLVVGLYMFVPTGDWLARVTANARRATGVGGVGAYPSPSRRRAVDTPSLRRLLDRVAGDVAESGFWRAVAWGLLDLVVVWVTAMLPLLFVVYGLFGVAVQPFVWRRIERGGGSNWYAFVHVDTSSAALWSIPLGVAFVVLGFALHPVADRAYAHWTAAMLAPTRGQMLAARNQDLTASRADVVDDRAAGLARIQRDLHDGAQARLVAMGMNLDQAVRALDADPARARLLLTEAQQLSSSALAELRDLVHGIHSPVLADRGLGDAIRSLVLDTGFDAEVRVGLPSRPAPPVEAAIYYAVSELVTNAAKHSKATAITIALTYGGNELTAVVRDNGVGGADPAAGHGLTGVDRRLAAFDGTLRVDSPAGGPTVATVVVPCTLS